MESSFVEKILSLTETTTLPGILLWLRDGISFPYPTPSWPLPSFGPCRPSPSPREKGFFKESKEQRGQEKSSPFFQEIEHPRPAFILNRDYFKDPKTSLTKSFPNMQPKFSFFSMSQSLLVIQSSALQSCEISFFLYPQNTLMVSFNSLLWCIWKSIIYIEMTFQVMLSFDFVLQVL